MQDKIIYTTGVKTKDVFDDSNITLVDSSYNHERGFFKLVFKNNEDKDLVAFSEVLVGDERIVTSEISKFARFIERMDITIFPFKPNDFFDLNYITEVLGVEPSTKEEILIRAGEYNSREIVNSENLTEMINLINNEENHDYFRKCLKKSMMPDVYNLLKFDKIFFNKSAERFEAYR